MKKIKDVETLLFKNNSISIVKINESLQLYNDVISYNEIFDIVCYGILHNIKDEEFWKIKISATDIQNAKPLNLIYYISGGEKMWNDNTIYAKNWLEMSDIFLEYFESKIQKVLKLTTLKELKNRIIKYISIEDFYELAIKMNLVLRNETTL